MRRFLLHNIAIASALAWASLVHGAGFEPPIWADGLDAQSSEWLDFTVATGDPGNTPDVAGSTGDALLTQLTPGALITGGKNIYNPAAANTFEIAESVTTPLQIVVLQLWTAGTELDYDSLTLSYNETNTLSAVREELFRESGGQGDTVISRWTWDVRGRNLQSFLVHFTAAGPHNSLVAARLDAQLEPGGVLVHVIKDSPDLDRWNYPFNATPGTRAAAPIFGASSDEGIERHGHFIVGFDTADQVSPGRSAASYVIESARLVAMTTGNFEVPYDPTVDPASTFLPAEHEQYTPDEDAGRPIELFGTGFRNGFTPLTWEETTPFAPAEGERSAFPASLDQNGQIVDVIEAVNFASPVDLAPFAVGTLELLAPGELIPHETDVTFDLEVSNPTVQSYLQQALATGRVYFTITGLPDSAAVATRDYPEFATRDNLAYDSPRLELTVRVLESASILEVVSLDFTEARQSRIRFTAQENQTYRIRHTTDFSTWETVESPTLSFPEPGLAEWIDETSSASSRLYQIISE